MAAKATRLSTFQVAIQPDSNGGLAWATPRTFVASGAGSTTTAVCSTLAALSTTNKSFVGYVVECVSATNTQNIGLRRLVKSYVDSTGTLTFYAAFPAATASGDQFRMMVPPHPYIVASAAATAGGPISDSTRNEAANYWNTYRGNGGPYLYAIAGTNLSEANQITISDYTATGEFTLGSSLSGAVAIGNYFEIWQNPEIMNSALLDLSGEVIQRAPLHGGFGRKASARGVRSGAGTQELAFRGAGASLPGDAAESHVFLRCVFDPTVGTDSTLTTGSTTTSLAYSSGNAAVGRLVCTEDGSVTMVTADSGSAYTVSPAVASAPYTTDTLYGVCQYTPADEVNSALSIKQWRGKDIVQYAWGCVPVPTFAMARGDYLKIAMNIQATDWMQMGGSGTALSRAYDPLMSTVDPVKCGDARAMIDGVSWAVKSFSFDPGLDIQPRVNVAAPNEHDGFELVGDNPTGTLEVYLDSSTRKALDDFLAGKLVTICVQSGSAPGFPGIFAVWCYQCRYTGATIGDDAGHVTLSLPFEVCDHDTSALPRYAIGIV
jgi:hypothetical protein